MDRVNNKVKESVQSMRGKLAFLHQCLRNWAFVELVGKYQGSVDHLSLVVLQHESLLTIRKSFNLINLTPQIL